MVRWDEWPSRRSNRYPVRAYRPVSLSKTSLSQARPISLLDQPEEDEVTKTECFSGLIASTQADFRAPAADWKMSDGDRQSCQQAS